MSLLRRSGIISGRLVRFEQEGKAPRELLKLGSCAGKLGGSCIV